MSPKDFSLKNLFRDLEYTIFGTEVHALLWKIFPPHEGALILEPGCGSGKFGLSYAMKGCEVILLDIDPEVVNYARRLRGALNSLLGFPLPTQIRVGNIHRMHFSDNSFDLVFNEGVPQHWTDNEKRQGAIDQMVRVSKDTVVVIGNNGENPEELEKDRTEKFGYVGMPPERRCFSKNELEIRLKRAGLKEVNVEPVSPSVGTSKSYLIAGWGRKR